MNSATNDPQNFGTTFSQGTPASKADHVPFLTDMLAGTDTSGTVISANRRTVITNEDVSYENLAPCSHDKMDTRKFVLWQHTTAVKENKNPAISTTAIDVTSHNNWCSTVPVAAWSGLNKIRLMFWFGVQFEMDCKHVINFAPGPDEDKQNHLLHLH